jgi:hypothetical protein
MNPQVLSGPDVHEALPDFRTEKPVLVGLSHIPPAQGTEGFALAVVIAGALTTLTSAVIPQWT